MCVFLRLIQSIFKPLFEYNAVTYFHYQLFYSFNIIFILLFHDSN